MALLMKKIRLAIAVKVFGLVVIAWAGLYLVSLAQEPGGQQKQQTEEKKPSAVSSDKKAEEFEEVRSPFGIQRVPRKAGGSPFQQSAPPAVTPVVAAPVVSAVTAQNPAAPQPVAPTAAASQTTTAAPAAPASENSSGVSFQCANCDLLEFIRQIGTELKLNYIIDPKIKGLVTIHTYGDLKQGDLLPVLETVLRINGAAMVKTGNLYQIVPAAGARQLPLPIRRSGDSKEPLKEDAKVMQIVPMRFITAADMVKVLEPYLSDGGHMAYHSQGNILIITENSANLKKLLDLIDLFDSDVFQNKRVQLYAIKYNRARDLLPDLDKIFSAYALSSKESAIRFVAVERLNAIIAISSNPATASEVEKWMTKLDQPVQNLGVRNYVYKLENADAKKIEPLLLKIYGRNTGSSGTIPVQAASPMPGATPPPGGSQPQTGIDSIDKDKQEGVSGVIQGDIKIVADDVNNALIIRSSPLDFEVIKETLKQIDIVPRQVLIDVKIYEVVLTGNLSMGVSAFLQQRAADPKITTASFSSIAQTGGAPAGLNLSTFANIGMTREIVAFLNAQESRTRTRVLSAPSVLASDNIEAHIQVGQEIPTLSAQGVVPGGTGGGSLFTNSVQNRNTGIILNVTPRISSSGWVTLKVNQEVSSPGPPPSGSAIQSPSINIRAVGTQVTIKDGETIAIGGIISESKGLTKNRVPFLGDVPGLGLLFGNTSYTNNRTELIALITPRVIEDIDQANDVTEDLKTSLKSLKKDLRKLDQEISY